MQPDNILILLLGGSGQRFGSALPKQFFSFPVPEKSDKIFPLFVVTAEKLLEAIVFQKVVLVVGREFLQHEIFLNGLQTLKEKFSSVTWLVTEGGSSRHQSFLAGWFALLEEIFLENKFENHEKIFKIIQDFRIAVHDANRPYLSKEFLQRIEQGLQALCLKTPCFVPTLPSVNSVLQTDKFGNVLSYLKRDFIHSVQTPQLLYGEALWQIFSLQEKVNNSLEDSKTVFKPKPLGYTFAQENDEFTDEGSAMLHFGFRVLSLEGDRENIKITYRSDL